MNTAPPDRPTLEQITSLEAQHVLQTYRRQPVAFVAGEGVYLIDTEGRRYLDLLSGIGVASLGHAHPGLAAVLADQARTLVHTSNLYFHPLQGQLARRLTALSGLDRAFFCNSGTEAVEACLKFARRYWHAEGASGRTGIVALEHAFGGRTMGSLSVTWDDHYRGPFQPLIPGVTFVSATDPAQLRATVSESTAAVIAEPIQGEGGVRPLSAAFAATLHEVCTATGTLLIADEVQSGGGRTGTAFHARQLGLQPDLISIGKAIGAGFPIGAALVSQRVASRIAYGDHGTTYGGNLLACRAALYYLDQLEGGLLDHVRRVGAHLEAGLRALSGRCALIRDVRGRGLMWGLELDRDAAPVVAAALGRGLIVNRTAERVIRMLPPLVIREAEVDDALVRLEAALEETASGGQG
jgi:acetylornithine aminotransferase/acetylornithine/N-succinyldiaminopimelate aminotransferase